MRIGDRVLLDGQTVGTIERIRKTKCGAKRYGVRKYGSDSIRYYPVDRLTLESTSYSDDCSDDWDWMDDDEDAMSGASRRRRTHRPDSNLGFPVGSNGSLRIALRQMLRIEHPTSNAERLFDDYQRRFSTSISRIDRDRQVFRDFFKTLFSDPIFDDATRLIPNAESLIGRARSLLDALSDSDSPLPSGRAYDWALDAISAAASFPWDSSDLLRPCHAGCAAAELIASFYYPYYFRDVFDSIVKSMPVKPTRGYLVLVQLFIALHQAHLSRLLDSDLELASA